MVTSLLSCVQFLPCNTAITLYAIAEKNQSASNEIFIDFLLSERERKNPSVYIYEVLYLTIISLKEQSQTNSP